MSFSGGNASVVLFMLCALMMCAAKNSAAGQAPNKLRSGAGDRTGLHVTVYNKNLGLVKDKRAVKLPSGSLQLLFEDVAVQINPTTVSIRAKSAKGQATLDILEQNYEYDLISAQKLLDKYVGRTLKLVTFNPHTERTTIEEAMLISNNQSPVYEINGEITFGHPGRVLFPKLPENLMARPTLMWLMDNPEGGTYNIEASYLTGGITWRADYILSLDQSDTLAGLSGWVTIENKSGGEYPDAVLKLVAGEVATASEEADMMANRRVYAMAEPPSPQFAEEEFFEYHIYTLKRPSTLKNNQTKQIALLQAEGIALRKEYLVSGDTHSYRTSRGLTARKQPVEVYLEFDNKKEHNLGMPLPKGVVRLYKKDSSESIQFAGEDRIEHTPKDETVRIKAGEAFDITAERKQTLWRKQASDTYEAAFEIIIRNHKTEDVVVTVREPVPGDWKLVASSHEKEKSGAFTLDFSVPVEKDGEATLTYMVTMRF